jgi:hypothetical protein
LDGWQKKLINTEAIKNHQGPLEIYANSIEIWGKSQERNATWLFGRRQTLRKDNEEVRGWARVSARRELQEISTGGNIPKNWISLEPKFQ